MVDPLVDALYTLIRTGELSPGERVDQRVISERLEVSRTPLREALRALAADGILVRTPNAGYAVAKLSAGDVLHIPAKVAHQMKLDPGKQVTYFVAKVVE